MDVIEELQKPLRPRKGRGGRASSPRRPQKLSKPALDRMLRGAPEVMVKITSSARSMQRIRSQVTYLSRRGKVPIEDESGNVYLGPDATTDMLYPWAMSRHVIPETESKGTRRESHHVVWSMPANTDRAAVTQAARRTAEKLFAGYQYVMATHDDQPQPHVHMVIRTVALDGRKMNPRKADLQHWRETFADELQALGIEANATLRVHRGRTERAQSQDVQHIDERLKGRGAQSKVSKAQEQAAQDEIEGKASGWKGRAVLDEQRKDLLHTYAEQIRELLGGTMTDRKLGKNLAQFATNLPPVQTRHERLVREKREKQVVRGRE